MKRLLKILLLGLLAGTTQAAPFVVPTDANPPFHRDRLPIDTDSMGSLSRQLTSLAQGASLESPAQRRATAQALALALALNPANSSARDSLSQIAKGRSPSAPDDEKLSREKARIWQAYDWLASPEAGRHGNLLADLIGDSASVLDPESPSAATLGEAPERGNWAGWVASTNSFREWKHVEPEPLAQRDPENPDKQTDPVIPSEIKPSTASIGAVLFVYDQAADKYILRPTTVSMEATASGESEEGKALRIDISCREGSKWQDKENVSNPILEALHGLHGSRLPAGKVRITTGATGTYSFKRNNDDMTGPGFILANAAVTGIAPGATFIARLDGPDNLALPDYFWRNIETLSDGPGGRLVVPAAAEEYFTAILALEKTDFFLKYEVLLASSPAEAITLCSKVPDKSHADVYAKFKEIKDKSDSGALGSYLANRFVRQRLEELSQAAPYHLSAKLLAIQGAGKRPRVLEKKILASEIFEAIDEISKFTDLNIGDYEVGWVQSMEKTYDETRAHLDQLDRYTDLRDRDLVTRAKNLTSDLRSLYRTLRSRGEYDFKIDGIVEAYKTLAAENKELRTELSKLTGDPLPEDAQARAGAPAHALPGQIK
jgi:hypothetical protein